jgi:hypothetical protein
MTRSDLLASSSALLLLLTSCEGCGPSSAELRAATTAAAGATGEATRNARMTVAVEQAAATVATAVDDFDPQSEIAYRLSCRAAFESEDFDAATACLARAFEAGHETAAIRLLQTDVHIAAGEYELARAVLFGMRDDDLVPDEVGPRLMQAFAADGDFLRPVLTLERGVHLSRIRALGGGSTVTLKFRNEADENIAAFKPNQTRRQSNYRAEIAAFRLCPIIRCGFEIPYSFEARIERREFMRSYGIRSLDEEFLAAHEGYAANFVDLIWTREDGELYLHGVWKDWVPHFTKFPIEYDDVWDSWVDVNGDQADLEQPFSEAIASLRGRDRGHYSELVEEAGDLTTYDFARQISNILAFDFLINNWDRFSGIYYGVNCQFANGQLVSIDNGAGFMTRDASRPRARLEQVTRFSRSLVREVRLLDREALLPILFPDYSDDEIERFDSFWERRAELLDYIDRLIEEHGEDVVLFFP